MKILRSLGGPLIGLLRPEMRLWAGTDGKTFVGESSPSPSDYEAGGLLTEGREYPPCNAAKIVGEKAAGLLISMPFEISVIEKQVNHVYLAQVHYAPEYWMLSSVTPETFNLNESLFDEHIDFSSSGGDFVFFDSACRGSDIKDELIEFNLLKGKYTLSSLIHQFNDEVLLTLFRISTFS